MAKLKVVLLTDPKVIVTGFVPRSGWLYLCQSKFKPLRLSLGTTFTVTGHLPHFAKQHCHIRYQTLLSITR